MRSTWSISPWPERRAQVDCLKAHGYGFYIYAPKADVFLRRRWRETPPPETRDGLAALHYGSYHKASKALARAVEIDPSYAMAHAYLAEAWYELD